MIVKIPTDTLSSKPSTFKVDDQASQVLIYDESGNLMIIVADEGKRVSFTTYADKDFNVRARMLGAQVKLAD